jgi:3-deoxy-manno-octulosonate cytidylyltransferase (CMP-KDO synthetase)
MKVLGVIPARFASTRFPGKPLVDILGKPMIQRVYEQAMKAKYLTDVYVATDDERILKVVESFGGKVLMTSETHQNGTERCAEVASTLNDQYDIVVNIQGDEPYIFPEQIDELVSCFENEKTEIATLKKKIEHAELLDNNGVIKVVTNHENFALYFSRNTIPFLQGILKENWLEENTFYKHIGIYGFRKNVLDKVVILPKSPLEISESLEQLRWLYNGYNIYVKNTMYEAKSIDTPEDLEWVLINLKP